MENPDQTFTEAPSEKELPKNGILVPLLLIIEGKEFGQKFIIDKEKSVILIGRSRECDFLIHDGKISRKHIQIKREGDSTSLSYVLSDLSSTNGTYVNGNKVEEKKLESGDKILIGQTLISFVIKDSMDIEFDEKVMNLAIRDTLTGLYNRLSFNQTLNNEFTRALRYNKKLSLLFIDIDYFKQVNDTFGHSVGDAVLRRIGYVILDSIRMQDIPVRYGGEEFIVLVPEIDMEGAIIAANRIREKIETESFITEIGKFSVTVSIGISSFNMNMSKKEELINIADSNLYKAKSNGRNRVYPVSA